MSEVGRFPSFLCLSQPSATHSYRAYTDEILRGNVCAIGYSRAKMFAESAIIAFRYARAVTFIENVKSSRYCLGMVLGLG